MSYNGWTNYATWRVNLEIFDGLDPREMGWHKNTYDLLPILRDYVRDVLEMNAKQGLALDYALAFIEEVNWQEIAQSMIEAYADDEEQSDEDRGVLEQAAWHDTSAELM